VCSLAPKGAWQLLASISIRPRNQSGSPYSASGLKLILLFLGRWALQWSQDMMGDLLWAGLEHCASRYNSNLNFQIVLACTVMSRMMLIANYTFQNVGEGTEHSRVRGDSGHLGCCWSGETEAQVPQTCQ
jgi:hypothetical protein